MFRILAYSSARRLSTIGSMRQSTTERDLRIVPRRCMYRRAADISASARAVTVLRTMPLHAPRVQNWIFGTYVASSRPVIYQGVAAVIGSLSQQNARTNRFRRGRRGGGGSSARDSGRPRSLKKNNNGLLGLRTARAEQPLPSQSILSTSSYRQCELTFLRYPRVFRFSL